MALGHEVTVVPPRTGMFGYGQAVMSDGAGVHFGASEPRHDGAAIPEAPPVFARRPTRKRAVSDSRVGAQGAPARRFAGI